ncbi:hypothetical protein BH09ACT1_BH09ACT1_27890 [soil metagenome]
MTIHLKTPLRRTATIAIIPLLATLALGACSSGSTDDDDDRSSTRSTIAPSASSAAGSTALTTAAKTALSATGSGTIVSIEQEAGATSWEIVVVSADGNEQEIHTNAEGTTVTAGPDAQSSDADDLAENTALLSGATLDYARAAEILTDTVAGTVTELSLDEDDNAVRWEGDVVDASGTRHSIRIDAGTGAVVTNTVNNDSDD